GPGKRGGNRRRGRRQSLRRRRPNAVAGRRLVGPRPTRVSGRGKRGIPVRGRRLGNSVTCPVCGTVAVPGARFCHNCGAALPAAATLPATERRVVTGLFGDLSEVT